MRKYSSPKNYTEYSCLVCEYFSCHLTNIKRHVRLHTGERPFKCNFCHKHFNEKSHLKSHLKFIHEKQML